MKIIPNNPIPERDQKIIKKLISKVSINALADALDYSTPTIRKYGKKPVEADKEE